MPERRTGQIKAPIAGKAQCNRCSQSIRFAHGLDPAHGASFSKAKVGPMSEASVVSLAKIGNAAMRRSELAYFNKQMLIHELIRGSLVYRRQFTGEFSDSFAKRPACGTFMVA